MIALFLKPLAFFVLAFLYYVFVFRFSLWLGRLFPEGKMKRWLFRERWRGGSGPAANLDERLIHD